MAKKPTYEELEQKIKDLESEDFDRKQAEEDLLKERTLLKTIIDNIPVMLTHYNPDAHILYLNKEFEKIVGWKTEEVQDIDMMEKVYPDPDYRQQAVEYMQEASTEWREFRVQSKSGKIIDSEWSNICMEDGTQIGIGMDITERKRAVEALRESEELHKEAQRVAHIGHWELYPEIGTPVWSDEIFRIFGLNPQESEPSFTDHETHLHPDDWPLLNNAVTLASVEGTPFDIIFRIVRPDGEIRWMHAIGTTTKDEKGKVTKLFGTAQDITGLKRTEEALRESEVRLAASNQLLAGILEHTHMMAVFLDPRFNFIWVNRAYADTCSHEPSFFPGKNHFDLYPHEENQAIFQGVVNTGEPFFVEAKPFEFPDQPERSVTYWDWSLIPVKDDTGKVTNLVFTLSEVTKRVRAEKALRESEEKYRTVLESNPDPVVVYDMEGKVTYFNLAFTRVFAWSLEDQIGKKIDNFVPEENWPETKKMINKIAVLGESFSGLEARRYTKEGNILNISISGSCYRDQEGNVAASIINLRDVTAQKRLEDQLQQISKMEAIGTLTGGIAHDYNNLMAIIMGNLSMAQEEAEPGSDLADFLNEANMASHKVRDLTHELMSLSKGGRPVREVGSLNEVLKNVSEFIPADSGISLMESISQDLKFVPYDRLKMRAVIKNVVKNAVEAMPDGGTLKIKAENLRVEDAKQDSGLSLKPGDFVHISIQDQGKGIPKESLDKIFDPYFSTKAMGTQKGMGLGLATSYAIVQKHGGHIQIDSSPGVGTTLNIYLPAESQPEEIHSATTSTDNKTSPLKRVLVMDDEEGLRNLSQKMLGRLGYKVDTVKDGVEAIETYKRNMVSGEPFDAVILDLTIKGGMGGEQTIQELLKIDPDVKAIVSSGYFNDPVMSDFQKYGFKGAMPKPYEKSTLKEVLEKLSG